MQADTSSSGAWPGGKQRRQAPALRRGGAAARAGGGGEFRWALREPSLINCPVNTHPTQTIARISCHTERYQLFCMHTPPRLCSRHAAFTSASMITGKADVAAATRERRLPTTPRLIDAYSATDDVFFFFLIRRYANMRSSMLSS